MTAPHAKQAIWLERGEALGRYLLRILNGIRRAFDQVCLHAAQLAANKYPARMPSLFRRQE